MSAASPARRRLRFSLWRGALLLSFACTGSREALSRGQAYYEDNQYERALSVWRELEHQQTSLPAPERSRYAYLRGMTDYRLGFRDDARHWLALARAAETHHPGGLDPAWIVRLDEALAELGRDRTGAPAVESDAVQSIEAEEAEQPPIEPRPIEPLPSPTSPRAPIPEAPPLLLDPPAADPAIKPRGGIERND